MAALPPWPHTPAAMETRVIPRGHVVVTTGDPNESRASDCPSSSVRIHGDVLVFHGTRRIAATGRCGWDDIADSTDPVVRELDILAEVSDPADVFLRPDALRELIYGMLVQAPATGQYDLAADNWESFLPDYLGTFIAAQVRRRTDENGGVVPWLGLDIEIPQLWIYLVYSEPKALILACKEAAAAAMVAGTNEDPKRGREPGEELCPICLLELEIGDEGVTLPCSHTFHTPCIAPWFCRASTCPNCRYDLMERFSFVRSLRQDDLRYHRVEDVQSIPSGSEDEQS